MQFYNSRLSARLLTPLTLSLVIVVLHLSLACITTAATNDLSALLKKGLFEEEANHNLEAAEKAYNAVASEFDKDRKLAATAIFRLGEVYRKQGKTNEANVQHERILREFPDQTPLVSLSRTYLGKSTSVASSDLSTNERRRALEQLRAAALAEQVEHEALIATLRKMPGDRLRTVLPSMVPSVDPNFKGQLTTLGYSEIELARLKGKYGDEHPEVKDRQNKIDQQNQHIDQAVADVFVSLETKAASARARVEALDQELNAARGTTSGVAATTTSSQAGISNDSIILDNPEASFLGTWASAQNAPNKFGPDYKFAATDSRDTTSHAIYKPDFRVAGEYHVEIFFPSGSNRATNAPWTIHADQKGKFFDQTIPVNQQINGGKWLRIGTNIFFNTGRSSTVTLTNKTFSTGRIVVADAVRFVPANAPGSTATSDRVSTPAEEAEEIRRIQGERRSKE